MRIHSIPLMLVLFASVAYAAQEELDSPPLKPQNGEKELADLNEVIKEMEYKDKRGRLKKISEARLSRVEPDGIVFMHKSGVSKVPFDSLPKEYQKKYGYNEDEAKEFAANVAQQQAAYHRHMSKVIETQNEKAALEAAQRRRQEADAQAQEARARAANRQHMIDRAAQHEASENREAALRSMKKAIRTMRPNDEARAIAALTAHAPDALQAYNSYLQAKQARIEAQRTNMEQQQLRQMQSDIDQLRHKILGY